MGRLWTGQIGLSTGGLPFIGPYIEWDTRIGGRYRWRDATLTGGNFPNSGYNEGYVMINSGSSQGDPGLIGAQPDDMIGDGQQHVFDCYTEDGYESAEGIVNGTQNEWYIHWSSSGAGWDPWDPLGGFDDERVGWTWVAALNNVVPFHNFAFCRLDMFSPDVALFMQAYAEPGLANSTVLLTRQWSGRDNENNNYAAFTAPSLTNCTFVAASRFFNGPGSVEPDVPLPQHRGAWMIYGAGPTIASLYDPAYLDYGETHDHYANATPFTGGNVTRIEAFMDITDEYDDAYIGQYPSPPGGGNPNPNGKWTKGFFAAALYRGYPTTAQLVALHNYYHATAIPPRPFPTPSALLLRGPRSLPTATATGSTHIDEPRRPLRPPGAP